MVKSDPPIPTDFSAFLKARLLETGMTQEQFADHCGFSQSYISRLASGSQSPAAAACRTLDEKLIMTEAQRAEFFRLAAEARGFKP